MFAFTSCSAAFCGEILILSKVADEMNRNENEISSNRYSGCRGAEIESENCFFGRNEGSVKIGILWNIMCWNITRKWSKLWGIALVGKTERRVQRLHFTQKPFLTDERLNLALKHPERDSASWRLQQVKNTHVMWFPGSCFCLVFSEGQLNSLNTSLFSIQSLVYFASIVQADETWCRRA